MYPYGASSFSALEKKERKKEKPGTVSESTTPIRVAPRGPPCRPLRSTVCLCLSFRETPGGKLKQGELHLNAFSLHFLVHHSVCLWCLEQTVSSNTLQPHHKLVSRPHPCQHTRGSMGWRWMSGPEATNTVSFLILPCAGI